MHQREEALASQIQEAVHHDDGHQHANTRNDGSRTRWWGMGGHSDHFLKCRVCMYAFHMLQQAHMHFLLLIAAPAKTHKPYVQR